MPRFTLKAPGPWGEKSAGDYGYAMVLEIDGRVELSGQGGWTPQSLDFPGAAVSLEAEINQAFENVAFMLGQIGLGWSDVGHVNSYHTPEADGTILRATAEMARQFRLRAPQMPIWTCLGVAVLGDPAMRVEIRVTAFRP